MKHLNRDLRKPISYCCKQMKHELSKRDIVDYTWYTRDYIVRSSMAPQVSAQVEFCPWCGKYVGKYSVHDEYLEAYCKAKQENPTRLDSELEEFREKFLTNWESHNQILEKNQTRQYNNYNQERLKEFLTNAKDDGLVVPRTPILNTFQTEKIINAVIDEAELDCKEQALILLAILFQKGGTARQCDDNLEAEVQGKKLRLKKVRDYMREVGFVRIERRLARSLATLIYEVCSSLKIPGNLARVILNNETNMLTDATDEDRAWMSDFQNDNEDCPERIRQLINSHLKTNLRTESKKG